MIRSEIEKLYITNSDGVFPPQYTFVEVEKEVNGEKIKYFDYTITKSVDEVYQEFLDNKNNPQTPQSTTEETLSKEIASLKISDMKNNTIIASTLQTIANLKVEVMGMKGGNI